MPPCPSCGFSQNRDTARFCSSCAAPLTAPAPLVCPRCSAQNAAGARFCANCAASLGSSTPVVAMTGLLPPNAILQSRYVVLRKLGQGGMGAVYQAQDARLQGKLWAVKEMSDALLTDPSERQAAVASFHREAQLLATLDHPNLPKVADSFEENGKHYLVMDFVDGQTLDQVVTATPGLLPEPAVLGWAEQICDVLEYLHTRQPPIVFRDLKPSNIMLTLEGKIKLIDFGIVRFFKPGKTKDTAQYGTLGYAAPEQFGTGQTDARSDIYSLGVTLYYLLTKYDPTLTPFNLPPARNINPLVSAQTEAVIARATRAVTHERFQTAAEMKRALLTPTTMPVPSTPLPLVPPSVSAARNPYVFAPGKIANTAQELARLCEGDREHAAAQLYDGYFEQWLRSIGEYGLASDAKRIMDKPATDPLERALGLQQWLERTGISLTLPFLEVTPTALDFGQINRTTAQQFRAHNRGGGILTAQISADRAWLEISPPTFRANDFVVAITIDPYVLPATYATYHGSIAIQSNGGTRTIQVSVKRF